MRKMTLLAAAVLGIAGASANAALKVTETVTPGTGALLNFDIHRYFASFDPTTSPEALLGAQGLQSVQVRIDTLFAPGDIITPSTSNLKFKFTDLDFDGENDVDVTGATIPDTTARTNNSTIGTIVRVNPSGSFAPQTITPAGSKSDTNSDGVPDTFPTQNYASVKNFRVEGFEKNPPDGPGFDASAKSTGPGALFAIAVVPTGKAVRAYGGVAADKGEITPFDTVPEPTTLGLVSIAAVGMLARRRRA